MLDELGIVGRSTRALRRLVTLAVCEENSVKSARELPASHGVDIDHKAALRLTYLVADDALRARRHAQLATKVGFDSGEFAGLPAVMAWMLEKMNKVDDVFRPRVKVLDASRWEGEEA